MLLDGADADRMPDASGHPITPFTTVKKEVL